MTQKMAAWRTRWNNLWRTIVPKEPHRRTLLTVALWLLILAFLADLAEVVFLLQQQVPPGATARQSQAFIWHLDLALLRAGWGLPVLWIGIAVVSHVQTVLRRRLQAAATADSPPSVWPPAPTPERQVQNADPEPPPLLAQMGNGLFLVIMTSVQQNTHPLSLPRSPVPAPARQSVAAKPLRQTEQARSFRP